MRWTFDELTHELRNDRRRRVLFVEGLRDLAFWKGLVPHAERQDTVIYPVSVVECPALEGGERGRLLWLAREMFATIFRGRVHFFADADVDRILGIALSENVSLTDGRDLESYGLSVNCLNEICATGLSRDDDARMVLRFVREISRPIGVLRVASARANLNMRFQHTLTDKTVRKFVVRQDGACRLDLPRLVNNLLQNSNISLRESPRIMSLHIEEESRQAVLADAELIHGKDFIRCLAMYFDDTSEHMEALLFMAIRCSIDQIRQCRNIEFVEGWVRAAQT